MRELQTRLDTVDFGVHDADCSMALDLHLFNRCEDGAEPGFLRFYAWSGPTLSLGFFENGDVIDRVKAAHDGVRIVRRPTGGRVVLHGDDLTYMVVTRLRKDGGPQDAFRVISECIVGGLRSLGVDAALKRGAGGKSGVRLKPCFLSTSRYEITYRGRKIVGSAQKTGRRAVLQHGSIPLGRGYLKVVDYMNCDAQMRANLLTEMSASTCCLYELMVSRPSASELSHVVTRAFGERFGLGAGPTKALDSKSLAFI